jgi:hypothetical protein
MAWLLLFHLQAETRKLYTYVVQVFHRAVHVATVVAATGATREAPAKHVSQQKKPPLKSVKVSARQQPGKERYAAGQRRRVVNIAGSMCDELLFRVPWKLLMTGSVLNIEKRHK